MKIPMCRSYNVKIPMCRSYNVKIPMCRSYNMKIPMCRSYNVKIPMCRSYVVAANSNCSWIDDIDNPNIPCLYICIRTEDDLQNCKMEINVY